MQESISFELFKSNVCHRVKDIGDIPFVIETLRFDEIRSYHNRKQYPQAFYLLAMVDYLSRENGLPLCNAYSDMRKQKLAAPLYPQSVLAMAKVTEDDAVLAESFKNAIPEFKNFNIAESEVRNILTEPPLTKKSRFIGSSEAADKMFCSLLSGSSGCINNVMIKINPKVS